MGIDWDTTYLKGDMFLPKCISILMGRIKIPKCISILMGRIKIILNVQLKINLAIIFLSL